MLIYFYFLLALACSAECACYWRNGTENPSTDYEPCSADISNPLHTICCARWDTCLPNGLCQSGFDQDIWRETCTKKNWNEGGCQELCSNERDSQRSDNIKVTPCDGTSSSLTWCCGHNNTACCADGSNVSRYTIARIFGDPIPTAISKSSSSTLASSATTSPISLSLLPSTISTTPPASTTPHTSNEGLSSGAKAGIGFGTAFGVLALISLGIFLRKAMQWRKKALNTETDHGVIQSYVEAYRPTEESRTPPNDGKWAHQVPAGEYEERVHEMPATRDTVEILTSSNGTGGPDSKGPIGP